MARTARAEPSCAEALPDLEQEHARSGDRELLHRIGVCRGEIGDLTGAATALKRYLTESGSALEGEQRTEVEATLASFDKRMGRVFVASGLPDVEVQIDGTCPVDEGAKEPACTSRATSRVLVVNPGPHRLVVKHPGFQAQEHRLDVHPGEELHVHVRGAVVESNPYRDRMWTAWGVTAGALFGSGILGVRTVLRGEGIDSGGGIATVALGAAALVAAGVATYFTVRSSRWRPTAIGEAFALRFRF